MGVDTFLLLSDTSALRLFDSSLRRRSIAKYPARNTSSEGSIIFSNSSTIVINVREHFVLS
jgi:hypothetical protein